MANASIPRVPPLSTPPRIGLEAPARVEVRHHLRSHWLGEALECFDPKADEALYVIAIDPAVRVPRLRLQRLLRELTKPRSEGVLSKPRMVTLADRRLGLAYPWIDGVSLGELVGGAPMAPDRAMSVLRQAAGLVADLHEEGLHHGAITLDALILTAGDGKLDTLTLGDYGLRQLFEKHEHFAPGAAADRVPVAPERTLGIGGGKSEDIYALGVLGFTLLTGEAPLLGSDADETIRRHAIEDAPRLEEFLSDYAGAAALSDVISTCMAKEPTDRYAAATGLDRALARATLGEPMASVAAVKPRRAFSADELELSVPQRAQTEEPNSVLPVPVPSMSPQRAANDVPSANDPPTATALDPDLDFERELRRSRRRRHMVVAGLGLALLGATAWALLTPQVARESNRTTDSGAAMAVAPVDGDAMGAKFGRADGQGRPTSPDAASFADEVPTTPTVLGVEAEAEAEAAEPGGASDDNDDDDEDDDDDDDDLILDEEPAGPRMPTQRPDAAQAWTTSNVANASSGTTRRSQAKAWAAKGRRALSSGKTSSAERYFKKALEANPRNLTALSGMRSISFNRGDYAAAVRYGERATRVSPRSASQQLALGDAYYRAGRKAEAKAAYTRAKQLGSSSAKKRLAKF